MLCDAPARKPRTHASHTAPPLPGRDHSRSPSTRVHVCLPRAPLTVVAHDSGPDRRLTALYETMFGSTSTCSSRASQRYHPRVRQPPSWHPAFESGVQNQVRPPLLTATLCPDRGTAEPSCTPYVCRVQPKHPCIAPRAQPARAVPVPCPEHARTHQPPCRPHVAGAHVSGTGWRLPGCEKTFFGAISTCASASSQRCHVRVRLLPCAVASCCLPWCLAVMPVRGRW